MIEPAPAEPRASINAFFCIISCQMLILAPDHTKDVFMRYAMMAVTDQWQALVTQAEFGTSN